MPGYWIRILLLAAVPAAGQELELRIPSTPSSPATGSAPGTYIHG